MLLLLGSMWEVGDAARNYRTAFRGRDIPIDVHLR